jgi:hypothetical protein
VYVSPSHSKTQLKKPAGFENVRDDILKTYGYSSQAIALNKAIESLAHMKSQQGKNNI